MLKFISNNKKVLTGMLLGLIVGILYWFYYGCSIELFPLSSEWWVNGILGSISGGFIVSVLEYEL